MIKFISIEESIPFQKFKGLYEDADIKNEKNIDAACISSLNKTRNEISSRFVNIKYIKENKFYFYSNYYSNKAKDFDEHNQVAISFFWKSINVQIRIKANIMKASAKESDNYFKTRDINKNSLAISSKQSNKIDSFEDVKKKYLKVLNSNNIDKLNRPKYWGGYFFIPYSFEFWRGDDNRLNEREEFKIINQKWLSTFLEP